jgi:uncharacterized repeat protein (TIGR03803 family)
MQVLCGPALVLPAFAVQPGAVLTVLHSFHVSPNGENPGAALVQSRDGYFYGTTARGGTNGGFGTVFRMSSNGSITSLYSFTGGNDGAGPGGLVQGSDGYFYGTTWGGGENHGGTVFRIGTNGVLTTLYSFMGRNSDGSSPRSQAGWCRAMMAFSMARPPAMARTIPGPFFALRCCPCSKR